MKTLDLVAGLTVVVSCLGGCSGEASDWSSAVAADSTEAYGAYLTNHPTGANADVARSRIQLLSWEVAKTTDSLESYRGFLDEHPDGESADLARSRIEELEWTVALDQRDRAKIEACLETYPASSRTEEAREVLWSLDWPAVDVAKANNVTIYSAGSGVTRGEFVMSLGGFGGVSDTKPAGPIHVYIWRDFGPNEIEAATDLGLRPGHAYLRSEAGAYQFVRKVDLSKSDTELSASFGIEGM